MSTGSPTPGNCPADEIARHAIQRGHWPGCTQDQIQALVDAVRGGWQNRYTSPSGETIYRKGDVIVLENPARGEGTIFKPTSDALEYFRRWVRRNPGGI